MATTHYAEIKLFALETEGVENGSCEFDVSSLRPTYKLSIGVPGKSNAFAISQRLGIRSEIVNRAKELVSYESAKFEDAFAAGTNAPEPCQRIGGGAAFKGTGANYQKGDR